MKNLEAKQEAIKKAYGEYWEDVRRCIDEKGWCSFNLKTYFKEDLIDSKVYRDKFLYRPKSLKGIENNNGWIKIDDFVKYTNETFWLFNSHINDLYQGQLFDDDMFPINRYATHYQPIEKPLKPIY